LTFLPSIFLCIIQCFSLVSCCSSSLCDAYLLNFLPRCPRVISPVVFNAQMAQP
jgi:hypothetical protein